MKNSYIALGIFITYITLLTGFTNDIGQQNFPTKKMAGASISNHLSELPKMNIGNVRVVKGNKGQKSVEIMVSLSQITSDPVTVEYRTKDGTAKAGADYVAASGSITFAPGETLKRISVFIIGEVAAEADEDAPVVAEAGFEINLTNVRNALFENSTAIITIIRDILRDPRFAGGNRSVYEVKLTYTGYTLLHGTLSDCPIRSNGKVVLTGLLEGIENLASDNYDDIDYRGILQLDIDMDICSVKGYDDNAKLCGITVTGSGPVNTELNIYYDGRGGYININDTTSSGFRKNAVGTCEQAEIAEERTMIPFKTIATIFNGLDLPMLTNRTLRVGRYVDTGDGNETVVEVLRKIR